MPFVTPPLDGVAGWPLERVDMLRITPPLDGVAGWPPERVDMLWVLGQINPEIFGIALFRRDLFQNYF